MLSYRRKPLLIIRVDFLMNYEELMLLAKHVTDARPQAEFYFIFVVKELFSRGLQ